VQRQIQALVFDKNNQESFEKNKVAPLEK